jgi:hypothetical protein
VLALVGLLCAAGMGVAAYVVSRDSVAVPVTRLQPKPRALTPAKVRSRQRTNTRPAPPPPPATTVDDHGGRRGGGGNSGHGGGGDD